jgi:hypothetical protein
VAPTRTAARAGPLPTLVEEALNSINSVASAHECSARPEKANPRAFDSGWKSEGSHVFGILDGIFSRFLLRRAPADGVAWRYRVRQATWIANSCQKVRISEVHVMLPLTSASQVVVMRRA